MKDEIKKRLVELLKTWQEIEDNAMRNTTEAIKKSQSPIVRSIMEIIRQDSAMHRKLQGFMIDAFESIEASLNCGEAKETEELCKLIQAHNRLEKTTVELAIEFSHLFEMVEALSEKGRTLSEADELESRKIKMIKYILSYLLKDEEKHVLLLEELEKLQLEFPNEEGKASDKQ